MSKIKWPLWLGLIAMAVACTHDPSMPAPPPEPEPDPGPVIYTIPIVVHVIHMGEPVGEGHNLSKAQIESQIRVLNEDYRRKAGTPGFNDHPDGGDARIEFVLARQDPDGQPTDGIVRIDQTVLDNPVDFGDRFNHYAWYSYWDPAAYLNLWSVPLPGLEDLVLGEATGPQTDLPGADLFSPGEPTQSEGVIINSAHFGPVDEPYEANMGRTATHEIGHYLGLLHTWGKGDCATNDFCDDTPPVDRHHGSCAGAPPSACDGRPVMVENYMNYAPDSCYIVFTRDQIARMHHVLENSPFRKSLLVSRGLGG